MHQNSPFWAQKSKTFSKEGLSRYPVGSRRGGAPLPTPHPLGVLPRSSRLRRSTWLAPSALGARPGPLLRLRPMRLHSLPSHTFWIRPWSKGKRKHRKSVQYEFQLFFTARRYASAVYSTNLCLSVGLSI